MSEPLSAEQIAREAAEELYDVLSGMQTWCEGPRDRAVPYAEAIVLAALRRRADALAAGSPLGEGRLAEIRHALDEFDWKILASEAAWRDLLAELDRVDALLVLYQGGEEQQCYLSGFDAGKRAGAREQKAADVLAARAAYVIHGGSHVLDAVKGAPLVAGEETGRAT